MSILEQKWIHTRYVKTTNVFIFIYDSGAFEVKMAPHSERKTTIMCSYEAKDVGEYTITVMWSGLEVPGSPFKVVLTDQIDSSL